MKWRDAVHKILLVCEFQAATDELKVVRCNDRYLMAALKGIYTMAFCFVIFELKLQCEVDFKKILIFGFGGKITCVIQTKDIVF